MSISAIVITKNAGATIRRCLESVQWADEIIVVDSGSTDNTLHIAQALGAKTHVTDDWPGPGPQRNRAIARATGDWILALDADEWVTEASRREIENVVQSPGTVVAYRLPRSSSFCGRYMRHSGWWPDYVSRLFRRGRAQYGGGIVHDHLVPDGPVGRLREHLMHEAITDLDMMLVKMNSYSTAGAVMARDRGRRASLFTALLHGAWAFFRTYVLRLGFLDGREGFLLAIGNAEGTYYRYVKLMFLGERKP